MRQWQQIDALALCVRPDDVFQSRGAHESRDGHAAHQQDRSRAHQFQLALQKRRQSASSGGDGLRSPSPRGFFPGSQRVRDAIYTSRCSAPGAKPARCSHESSTRPPGPLKGRLRSTERCPGAWPITSARSPILPRYPATAFAAPRYPASTHARQAAICSCSAASAVSRSAVRQLAGSGGKMRGGAARRWRADDAAVAGAPRPAAWELLKGEGDASRRLRTRRGCGCRVAHPGLPPGAPYRAG